MYRQQIHTKYVEIPVLESVFEKVCGYVLSESKELQKNRMCIIIMDAFVS